MYVFVKLLLVVLLIVSSKHHLFILLISNSLIVGVKPKGIHRQHKLVAQMKKCYQRNRRGGSDFQLKSQNNLYS